MYRSIKIHTAHCTFFSWLSTVTNYHTALGTGTEYPDSLSVSNIGHVQIKCPRLVIPNKILFQNSSAPEVKHFIPGIPLTSSHNPPRLEINFSQSKAIIKLLT
ncbi:hypothetical protein V8G54_006955 [Vigna mungo]|uniref:Uncharacterized protein n=1 Tax=Vigna mungo TaxID=3915 RepID=A0AAQ3P1E6_VIGMU